jgi:hypothetical protein
LLSCAREYQLLTATTLQARQHNQATTFLHRAGLYQQTHAQLQKLQFSRFDHQHTEPSEHHFTQRHAFQPELRDTGQQQHEPEQTIHQQRPQGPNFLA